MIKNVLELNWVSHSNVWSSNLVGYYFSSILIVEELFIQTWMIKMYLYIKRGKGNLQNWLRLII